jgi:hypothetical protein
VVLAIQALEELAERQGMSLIRVEVCQFLWLEKSVELVPPPLRLEQIKLKLLEIMMRQLEEKVEMDQVVLVVLRRRLGLKQEQC